MPQSPAWLGLVVKAQAQDAVIHAGYLLAKPEKVISRRQTILMKTKRIVSVEVVTNWPEGCPGN
ncbi:MAG: hypothetical protein R3C04_02155 [Hyphomonas sp.]